MSYYLGLDIGGTNVRAVIYDEDKNRIGHPVKRAFRKMDSAKSEVEENISCLIKSSIESNGLDMKSLKGIGISSAALFDREKGEIKNWPNNSLWNGFPLKKHLEQEFGVPVAMEDDANSAALGEYLLGAGKGIKNFAYITISTGIGCGLVLNGSIYTGINGWAGEIGHIKVENEGPLCRCGQRGCLQALASGPAIYRRGCELAVMQGVDISMITELQDIAQYASGGSDWALKAFEEAGKHIARMVYYLAMILDIDLVVLAGGVMKAGSIILNPIEKEIASDFIYMKRKLTLKGSELGDNSGAIGALSLAYNHINSSDIKLEDKLRHGNYEVLKGGF
ncbi:MAG TPA: ROK family protein [Clostridia bacterium]|nr:ROK family protein [Clostridia bacterium]